MGILFLLGIWWAKRCPNEKGAKHIGALHTITLYRENRVFTIEKTEFSRGVFTFPPAFKRGRISLVVVMLRQTRDAVVLPCLYSPW